MGTSTSSKGPSSGVSLDPTWLNEIAVAIAGEEASIVMTGRFGVAPQKRFYEARTCLRSFIRTGSKPKLKEGLRHYVAKGMGGARAAAARMRFSALVGAQVVSYFISSAEDETRQETPRLLDLIRRGLSVEDIAITIAKDVFKEYGVLDEESAKDSLVESLIEFLSEKEDSEAIDSLDADDLWDWLAIFIYKEIYKRVYLDVAQAFENDSLPAEEIVARTKELESYIHAEVSKIVSKKKASQQVVRARDCAMIIIDIIQSVMYVFGGVE